MKKAFRRSLTPGDRSNFRTSLYEDTYPGNPPEVGEYPVRGNAELPEHMKRHPYSAERERAIRANRLPQTSADAEPTGQTSPQSPVIPSFQAPHSSTAPASSFSSPPPAARSPPLASNSPSPSTRYPASAPNSKSPAEVTPQANRSRANPPPITASPGSPPRSRNDGLANGSKPAPASPSSPPRSNRPPMLQSAVAQAQRAAQRQDAAGNRPEGNVTEARRYSGNAGDRNSNAIKPADLNDPEYSYMSKIYRTQSPPRGNGVPAKSITKNASQPQSGDDDGQLDNPDISSPGGRREPVKATIAGHQRIYDTPNDIRRREGAQANLLPGRASQEQSEPPVQPSNATGPSQVVQSSNPPLDTTRPDIDDQQLLQARHPVEPQGQAAIQPSASVGGVDGQQRTPSIIRKRVGSGRLSGERQKLSSRDGVDDLDPPAEVFADTKADTVAPSRPDEPESIGQAQSHSVTSMDPSVPIEGAAEKPSLEGVVDVSNTVDTEVVTRQAPAVTHETVIPEVRRIREEVITREIHTYDVRHRILPIIDVQVLPPRHFVPVYGGLKEVAAEEVPGRQSHWQIVETVTPDRDAANPPRARSPPFREPIMESTRTYTTEGGYPRTETVWRHPPTLETGARDTGQTWPLPMDPIMPARFETQADSAPNTLAAANEASAGPTHPMSSIEGNDPQSVNETADQTQPSAAHSAVASDHPNYRGPGRSSLDKDFSMPVTASLSRQPPNQMALDEQHSQSDTFPLSDTDAPLPVSPDRGASSNVASRMNKAGPGHARTASNFSRHYSQASNPRNQYPNQTALDTSNGYPQSSIDAERHSRISGDMPIRGARPDTVASPNSNRDMANVGEDSRLSAEFQQSSAPRDPRVNLSKDVPPSARSSTSQYSQDGERVFQHSNASSMRHQHHPSALGGASLFQAEDPADAYLTDDQVRSEQVNDSSRPHQPSSAAKSSDVAMGDNVGTAVTGNGDEPRSALDPLSRSDVDGNFVASTAQPSASTTTLRHPGPRALDARPRSRDYSRMNQPPKDYYPVAAGSTFQEDSGERDPIERSNIEQGIPSSKRNSKDASQRWSMEQDGRHSSAKDSEVSSTSGDRDQILPHRVASVNAHESGPVGSTRESQPISPQSPSTVSGVSMHNFTNESHERTSSGPSSEQTPSEASGAELHNPASETDDNQGMIPVDLSTVGGLSQQDVHGLMPVEHAEYNDGDSFKTLRNHHPGAVDPRRPRMRDFAKDYIRSIAGSSADMPGESTVPGAFPGAVKDPALR